MTDFGADENLVRFITGVSSDGLVAGQSFQTWNGGSDYSSATFSSFSAARKWGDATPGTAATVSYAFDSGSHWTSTEQAAFVAAMHLWQAEAGITFTAAAPGTAAQITITRSHDGQAEGFIAGSSVAVGSATLGNATRGGVQIDTSGDGFGPIGGGFSEEGGYPWMTVEHELGHALGLGHPGVYDGNDSSPRQNGSHDFRALTIMSYFDADGSGYGYNWQEPDGSKGEPVTPQALDIDALQRLYGAPTNSALGPGTVFGFNSNIQGDIRQFFDFSINARPIVTLFSTGGDNTLDLSGFSSPSVGSLRGGVNSYLSAGGLVQNIAIAAGTHIDTVLLGAGNDRIDGNDDAGDVMMGGGGSDQLAGGAGNDHIYGYGSNSAPDDGADYLLGRDGDDYLQGNGGADTLDGGSGNDRLYGGADNDLIFGDDGNDTINGNRGNDTIDGGTGDDFVRGGQGDDVLRGCVVMGDLGNDRVEGNSTTSLLTGGDGADTFVFFNREAEYATKWADAYRLPEVTDYHSGTDHLHLDMGVPTQMIALGAQPSIQAAADAATATLGSGYFDGLFSTVADAQVGNDTLVFFWEPAVGMEGFRLDSLSVGQLSSADFT